LQVCRECRILPSVTPSYKGRLHHLRLTVPPLSASPAPEQKTPSASSLPAPATIRQAVLVEPAAQP
jgi:hypothetical protein